MYYITIDVNNSNNLQFYCRHCGHKDDADDTVCLLTTQIDNKDGGGNKRDEYIHTTINKYTKMDPTLPRVNNIPCPNEECKTHVEKNKNEVLYIRYDDERLLYLYMCCICDTVWKSSG
jgi:DNA-directed RNA polymerase subunit M/transcription elongation factor TFIIS